MKYSIVIPAYNEAERITQTLDEIRAWAKEQSTMQNACELIIVCDGCKDDTEAVVKKDAPDWLRVISYEENRGKGYAVRQGMNDSKGEIVLFMDADGSTSISELQRLAQFIENKEAEIVIASRRAKGAVVSPTQPLRRRVLGQAFSIFNRIVLRFPYIDTQCGFKVFKGDVAREMFSQMTCDHFGFDIEILTLARQLDYRIKEIGVHWHDVPGSKVNAIADGMTMLKTAWQLRRINKKT